MSNAESLIKEFARESLASVRSKPITYRKRKNGDLVLEVRRGSGLIEKIRLKESYITGVLGIKKKRLMESIDDPNFQKLVLQEHLLFEGWWDSAKQFIGDSIDKVKEKVEDGVGALKTYGENAKGAVAALWAAVQNEDSLNSLKGGALGMTSKAVAAINKGIFKIEKRLQELDMPDLAKILEKSRNFLVSMYDKVKSVDGWKGLLTALAAYMGFSWIREKIGQALQVFYDALSGKIEDFAKMMADGAANVAEDYKSIFQIGPGDPRERLKEFVKEKLTNLIPDTFKEKVAGLVGNAALSLAGPLDWLKKAYSTFKTSEWVLEKIMSSVKRGNFKVS